MAIKELKEVRRYRAYIKELERAEFIEVKSEKNKIEDGIEVELDNPIQRGVIPQHCGNKIDIFA